MGRGDLAAGINKRGAGFKGAVARGRVMLYAATFHSKKFIRR